MTGDGYIILPQASYNKPFSKVNADFFHQIIEMKHTCEVLHGSWRCWKEDKDTVILADDRQHTMYPVHYHIAITEFVIQLASCFLHNQRTA